MYQLDQGNVIYQQSELYIWMVIVMSIYYGIPAMQLVLKYQKNLLREGKSDSCYYNFLCAETISGIGVLDFNHLFSNIGYICYGLTFLLIVFYR